MQGEEDGFIHRPLPYFYFKVFMKDADVSISTNIVHAGFQLYSYAHESSGRVVLKGTKKPEVVLLTAFAKLVLSYKLRQHLSSF